MGVVALFSGSIFLMEWSAQPHFPDESAYISQSYFLGLLLDGRRDDPAWLEYPAFDLPPLPKYLIGAALRAGGYSDPGREAALAWYGDINRRFASPAMLGAARWPSVVLGVLGCLAIFGIGTIGADDPRVGAIAAGLLALNPLYRMHAGRAMADVPAEALILATAWAALLAWRGLLSGRWGPGRWAGGAVAVGTFGGLAVLAKLNGGLGLMIVAAWAVLALVLPGLPARRKAAFGGLAVALGMLAFGTFVALNPFLTAQPRGAIPPQLLRVVGRSLTERTEAVIRHRAEVSEGAKAQFPAYALDGPIEKLEVVAVQGFGRFGPLGPPHHSQVEYRRFDWPRDAGAVLWLPLVMAGAAWWLRRGAHQRREGRPPAAWAVVVQAALALVTVAAFLPLAWDRYLLSIQAGSALLGAGPLVAVLNGLCWGWNRVAGELD